MRNGVDADSEQGRVDRRDFLALVGLAVAGIVAAAAAGIAAVYVGAPALRRGGGRDGGEWSPIDGDAPASSAEPSRRTVSVVSDAGWATSQSTRAVFVDATAPGSVVAFSARCPHEGCQVEWSGQRSQFVCPCHNSSWTRDGERVGGPAKRGLDPLDVRLGESGRLEVRYETFVLDTADRIRLG